MFNSNFTIMINLPRCQEVKVMNIVLPNSLNFWIVTCGVAWISLASCFPIGPLKDFGPEVTPSIFRKTLFSADSFAWSPQPTSINGFCSSFSRRKTKPPFQPTFTLIGLGFGVLSYWYYLRGIYEVSTWYYLRVLLSGIPCT